MLAHAEWLHHQPLRLELVLRRNDALAQPEPVLQAVVDSALVVSNPGAAPPLDATTAGARGEHSTGFGLGLTILQRFLVRHGAQRVLAHADGVMRASVCVSGPSGRSGASAPAGPT